MITLVDSEELKIVTPEKDWSSSHALSVVLSDFDRAQAYRTNNHDWRWERADRRYEGVVPTKFWEGTNIERSHVSVMTAYEQVEALIPVVLQAIFGDDPWFEGTALGKTTAEEARICREIIAAQLYESRFRKILGLGIRSAYIYGNGILESSWKYCKYKKKKFRVVFDPKQQTITDPFTGQSYNVAGQGYTRRVVEQIVDEIENRPISTLIPITDFYIDPNAPSTDIEQAGYTITRTLETVGSLIEYRDEPGYDIPDDDELIEMTKDKPGTQGEMTQMNREATRDATWIPGTDQSVDPYSRRVEVLRYRTKQRMVWIVNRKHPIYNRTNEYGKMMQHSAFYTELLDRFYGKSIADVVDGEQLIQEGLINGRLDEVALSLHPHTKAKSSRQTPAYQLRVRPGGISYHENPDKDMVREFPNNVTQQAFEEVAASDMRVQKKTGLTDMALIGMSSGPNPGARSATGAGIQGRATQTRIQGQVENQTDEVVEPVLHDFHMLNQFHLDPDQRINAVNGTELDPLAIFSAEVRYSSRAASRMQAKIGLLNIMPYVMQYVMNPALVEQLHSRGETVDFIEIFQMLVDGTGYRKKADWIRKLTPQEQQALQQRQMTPDMMKWMMQKDRLNQMADMNANEIDQQGTIDMMKEIVKSKGDTNKEVVKHAIGGNTKSD